MAEISSLSVAANGVRGAYRHAQDLKTTGFPVAETSEATSFATMLRNAAQDAATTIRDGDKIAQLGMSGNVGTQQVVEATLALESTVKTVVAMRDKFVEAYQEVLRMPI
jgi:flagellar hook-basal body complex protein FliE